MPVGLEVGIQGHSGTRLETSKQGSAFVTQAPSVAALPSILTAPFSIALTVNNDGTTANLNVNGSTTPIDGYVDGITLGDFYVTTMNILISDDGAVALNKFGSLTALTNGIDILYSVQEREILLANVKTNYDLIRLGSLTQPIGGKTDAFQISNTTTDNQDSYNPIIDLRPLSPFGVGVRLRQNTLDRIVFRIKDDLTGIGTLSIRLAGFIQFVE